MAFVVVSGSRSACQKWPQPVSGSKQRLWQQKEPRNRTSESSVIHAEAQVDTGNMKHVKRVVVI